MVAAGASSGARVQQEQQSSHLRMREGTWTVRRVSYRSMPALYGPASSPSRACSRLHDAIDLIQLRQQPLHRPPVHRQRHRLHLGPRCLSG